MRVVLHIEEVVLHGFSPHERHRVGDALGEALARELAGAVAGLAELTGADRLDGGQVAVAPVPEATGAAIAGAVMSALRGPR